MSDVDDAVVRAREAPRTAVGNRRIDPFLVVMGVAVIIVGFFVGRGMGATDPGPPKVVVNQTGLHGAATAAPAATAAATALPGQTAAPIRGNSGSLPSRVVPVDTAYANSVTQVLDKNQTATEQTNQVNVGTSHQLVELTSATNGVSNAITDQYGSLRTQGAALAAQVAQYQGGDAEPTATPASDAGSAPSLALGNGIPGVMRGGFQSPAPFQLSAGWAIPVQSKFAVDSELSGDLTANVVGDVCDPRNDAVIIPDGATFHGKYLGLGPHRHLDFAWYRLTQPDQTWRTIAYVKTLDEEGHAGVAGKLSTHRWEYFRDTLVGSIANAGGQIIGGMLAKNPTLAVGGTTVSVPASAGVSEEVPSVVIGAVTPFNIYLEANYTVPAPYHGEFCRNTSP